MNVKIDQDGCIECGACESACPDVFVMDDDGKAAVVEQHRSKGPDEGTVPDDLSDCAQEAADGCPVDVISVT